MISAEDGAYTLASSGTEQSGESVDFPFLNMEVKRLDPGIALEAFRLDNVLRCVLSLVDKAVITDLGHIVHFFSEHLRHELHSRQILDLVFPYELSVS